jgi:uncharacterized damage-inducible protein DinB
MTEPAAPTSPIVTPCFVRMMAAYNTEMNRRLFEASARLSDEQRRMDRGAFWGSIHGTLNHILWGDTIWMSRFDGWASPALPQKQSACLIDDFDRLALARAKADARIADWAARVDAVWLAAEQAWFSGAAQRELRMNRGLLAVHFFNHQTHHRGQAHALVTAAGETTGDTDLFLMPEVVAVSGTG